MQRNDNELNKKKLEELSKEELIEELKTSKNETFKYVNKFLEVQEKWNFINILIKKMNTIRDKQSLCNEIADGFLKLTNSFVSFCCFFNLDSNKIEYQNLSIEGKFPDEKTLQSLLKKIEHDSLNFLQKTYPVKSITKYFASISKNQIIVIPITYNDYFLGYFVLVNENETFYKESYLFLTTFPEHIALNLANISHFEEAEKLNRQKIEFLAGISHEFKTPLNAIIGFSDILKTKSQNADVFKYIENISLSSKHLLTLIEDILDVAKSQYGKIILKYKTFSTKNVIIKTLNAMESLVKEKNIELSYTLLDVEIYADEKRFRQLIFNLTSNAIKFNKPNGKIIIFTYIRDNEFVFEISDSGDGISKKDNEKIFKFFSQVNRSQLKRQQGSGIGLALCRMIVEEHNGKINFESKLKKGSTFWFSLPLSQTIANVLDVKKEI